MKNKKYYLISEWCPSRGQTKENPAYFFCGGYFVHAPLKDVIPERCYKSEKMAQRYVDKHNLRCPWDWYEAVVEVPEECLRSVESA